MPGLLFREEIEVAGNCDDYSRQSNQGDYKSPSFGLASDLVVDGGWAGNTVVDAVARSNG